MKPARYCVSPTIIKTGSPGSSIPETGVCAINTTQTAALTRVGRLYSSNTGTACDSADELTDYHYDQRGRPSDINYPNGITRYIDYDQVTGQIVGIGYRKANGGLIFSDVYEYVPASRLYASVTRTTAISRGTTYYEYDTRERVKTVTEPDGRRTEYKYDAFGNRIEERILNIKGTEVQPGAKLYGTYTYGYIVNSNRLGRTLFNGTLLEIFNYDAAGRIVRREHTVNGVTTYSYDDRGMLVGVTKPGYTISYTYDALGTRKTKTVNGATTRYISASIFGLQRTLVEADSSMNILATYVHGGGEILKEEPSVIDRSQDLYYLTDGMLGSVRYSVDLNGKIQSTASYDTFGQRHTEQMGSIAGNGHYGYTGEMVEPETGLVFLRVRYYDPALGRFISVDPFLGRLSQPVTQNRYIYVQNNPLVATDPSGFDIYVIQHPVGQATGGGNSVGPLTPNHMAFVMIPDAPNDFVGYSQFSTNPLTGLTTATFGGQPTMNGQSGNSIFGNLHTVPSYPGDQIANANDIYRIPTPKGVSDTDHILAYLTAINSYDNSLSYFPVPALTTDSYNSNGYVTGIMGAVGDVPPSFPGFQPGAERPIPISPVLVRNDSGSMCY